MSEGGDDRYAAGLMASTHDEYTQMTRNSSQLDLTGAYISEDEEPGTPGDNPTESASAWTGTPEAPSIGLPQQTVDDVSHFSIGARARRVVSRVWGFGRGSLR